MPIPAASRILPWNCGATRKFARYTRSAPVLRIAYRSGNCADLRVYLLVTCANV